MRCSLLDIKITPQSRSPQPATVIRVQIQPRNRVRRSQQHRQLQLCVPLVNTDGQSYRLRDHHAPAETLRRAITATSR